jgi:predicted tellurium resistance membrane protein TerC
MEWLSSADFWIGLFEIVWSNTVLSGDNAVVIALAARTLPPEQQKKAVFFGSGASVVLRDVASAHPWLHYFSAAAGAVLVIGLGKSLQRRHAGPESRG